LWLPDYGDVKKSAKFWCIVFGLAALACLALWYFLIRVPYTRNEPKESDLIGVYRPNPKTQKLIEEEGAAFATNCAIQVEAKNKIELINILPWLTEGDTNMLREASNSTNGVWYLEKSDNGWVIVSEYEQHDGSISISFELTGEKPPYSIRICTWHTGIPFYTPCYFVQGAN
jgi:hypothetical protein